VFWIFPPRPFTPPNNDLAHGLSGAVQITQATYELIKDEFVCERRGTVNVKGKGEMEVWLVVSVK